MTVVVAGIGLSLTLLLATFLAQLGSTSSIKARAQLAADAAALAAVAESAPTGSGTPEGAARSYATANGGRLLSCACPQGGTAMQVRVAVSDVIAEARATLDPEALLPASLGFDRSGLAPLLAESVTRLVEAARGEVRVVSGWRTRAEQEELWRDALQRYGSPELADDWVARPGTSSHESGEAVDLGGDIALAVRLVERLGLPLGRPLGHEPWHFELT